MKRRDERGITHNLMLAGLAVMVLGAIGFAGMRVLKSRNDVEAQAAGYQSYGTSTKMYFCKKLVNVDGVSTWNVRVYGKNADKVSRTLTIYKPNGSTAGQYALKSGAMSPVLSWFVPKGSPAFAYNFQMSAGTVYITDISVTCS